jgi:hypothetical protein
LILGDAQAMLKNHIWCQNHVVDQTMIAKYLMPLCRELEYTHRTIRRHEL